MKVSSGKATKQSILKFNLKFISFEEMSPCGGQRTSCGSQVSPSSVCPGDQAQGFQLGASAFTHWDISPTPFFYSHKTFVYSFLHVEKSNLWTIWLFYLLCLTYFAYHFWNLCWFLTPWTDFRKHKFFLYYIYLFDNDKNVIVLF